MHQQVPPVVHGPGPYRSSKAQNQFDFTKVYGRCRPTLSEAVWGTNRFKWLFSFVILSGCLLTIYYHIKDDIYEYLQVIHILNCSLRSSYWGDRGWFQICWLWLVWPVVKLNPIRWPFPSPPILRSQDVRHEKRGNNSLSRCHNLLLGTGRAILSPNTTGIFTFQYMVY